MTNIIESTWLNRAHYEGAMDRFQEFKAIRKRKRQNLILFFKENNDINDQGSKLVRHYMNRSVIDEEDQCEISGTYSLSQPETYNKNGELHTFSQTYLANEWQQTDKQNKDKSLFELLISKLIKSEHARVREQDRFRDLREKIQDNVGRDNWSDKNWLNAKFIQSVESIEYINHFVISHFNNSKPQLYFLKAIIQNCFQRAASMLENKQDYEDIELTYASDLIEYSTIVTILSGSSQEFLTRARVQQNLIGDDLEHVYNMTATELLSNDELKNLNLYKLIEHSKFKSAENESELSEFIFKKRRKQYIQCQRFSFPMARIPLRKPKKSFDANVEYYLCFEEVERTHNAEIDPNMIRQWINKFVIVEDDQFEITCPASDCPTNVINQFKLSNNSRSMRSIMNLVTRSFWSWPLFATSDLDKRHFMELGKGLRQNLE